jgi:hypothetical protein
MMDHLIWAQSRFDNADFSSHEFLEIRVTRVTGLLLLQFSVLEIADNKRISAYIIQLCKADGGNTKLTSSCSIPLEENTD